MEWISTNEQLPPTNPNTGESEYVLAYPGHKCLPQVVMYSNGEWSKKGWHPAQDMGRVIPMFTGKGDKKRPAFTHWTNIELPKDE